NPAPPAYRIVHPSSWVAGRSVTGSNVIALQSPGAGTDTPSPFVSPSVSSFADVNTTPVAERPPRAPPDPVSHCPPAIFTTEAWIVTKADPPPMLKSPPSLM